MRKGWLIVVAGLLVVALAAGGCGGKTGGKPAAGGGEAAGSKETEFYKGKVIEFIVPYKTGGGYDAWARLIAPYLEKYTGATVVVKNIPGAGSLTGTNQLYAAEPNGLTIGILNGPGTMQAQLTNAEGVKFDLLKFTWLGRVTAEPRVIVVGPKAKYKTIEAMREAKEPVKFGAPGLGSSMFMDAALLGEALGIKMDIITGYETSEEVDLAVIRGELDAAAGSYPSKAAMVKTGDLIPVLQYGKEKIADLPNVPLLAELGGISDEGKKLIDIVVALGEIGRPIAAPPGVPPERAKFLEEALKKSLEDPGLIEMAKKQEQEVAYMSAEETRQLVDKGANLSPELKQKLQEILGRYQPAKAGK